MIQVCDQIKCKFHVSNLGQSQCPVCNECGAKSNLVETDLCINCHCCLKDEGFVRTGVPDTEIEQEEEPCQNQI